MMNAQEFYELAKANQACADGLRFVRKAALKINPDPSQVPVSKVFDAMLEDSRTLRAQNEQTFSGSGYLRWTFNNLMEWPARYSDGGKTSGIVSPILYEAGCRCKAFDRYGYFGAENAAPGDLFVHLKNSHNCKATKHLSESEHGARIDFALTTIHKALTRAFSDD